jgi:hypothetical protein
MRTVVGDKGQAVVLLLSVVTLAAISVVAVGALAGRVVDRGQAQIAADAAALAATSGGRPATDRLAAANGATLVGYRQVGDVVTVVVEFHHERSVARATDGP